MDTFFTINNTTQYLLKEKGSKFLGFAFPIQREEDIKQKLQDLRKQYFDASHHCFAYTLGVQKERYRAFDDREPKNSAGIPILGQIRSFGLCNVLVVVVRYFGGTKLGVGGLVQAYKQTALETLSRAVIVEKFMHTDIWIQYDYSQLNDLMRVCKKYHAEVQYLTSVEKPEMNISVRNSQLNGLLQELETFYTLKMCVLE